MTNYRLPEVNGDDGSWGTLLNQYLNKEHYNDDNGGVGTTDSGGHQNVTLRAGATGVGTAPLKFTSGPLMTAAEVGAIEFLTDSLYFTQTTGTTRKVIAAYDDSSGATGDLYYRDGGGNFVRLGVGSSGDILTVNSGVPVWDTILSGASQITVGLSAPGSPTTGDLWIDTNP
jgi:hypothetical protein